MPADIGVVGGRIAAIGDAKTGNFRNDIYEKKKATPPTLTAEDVAEAIGRQTDVHAVRFTVPLEKSYYPELKELFMLPYVAGVVLSIGVALFARRVGFDRDRAFYPTVLIVIASYYVLFAVMSGSVETVLVESIIMPLFAVAAVAGFKGSAWIVVAALAGHGVQDAVHGHIVANAGVPAWWPAFRSSATSTATAGSSATCTGTTTKATCSMAKAGARVMDLQDPTSKMSKSADTEAGCIMMMDTPADIARKFKRAVTDSDSEVRFKAPVSYQRGAGDADEALDLTLRVADLGLRAHVQRRDVLHASALPVS